MMGVHFQTGQGKGRFRSRRSERVARHGAALVFAIIVLGTVSVVSVMLVQSVVQRHFAFDRRERHLQAECLARSAMAFAEQQIADVPSEPVEAWTVSLPNLDAGTGSVEFRVEADRETSERLLVVVARVPATGINRSQVTLRAPLRENTGASSGTADESDASEQDLSAIVE